MNDTTETPTTHFTNFGVSYRPQCADGAGYLHYRKDFADLPASDWTPAEQWIADMTDQIEDFRGGEVIR